jgi:hypothetical protein
MTELLFCRLFKPVMGERTGRLYQIRANFLRAG